MNDNDTDNDKLVRLRHALRLGAARDVSFDRLYSDPIRARSAQFWTPVAVAARAAELFAGQNVANVLDIGSGVGKFCLTAGCACPEIKFTGIEQRPHLVDAARQVKAQLGTRNVRFLVGDATTPRWDEFDGLYLYNPFAENLYFHSDPLDHTVELSQRRLVADVRRVFAALVAAPVGMCMVTYNSFGGPVPGTYDLAHAERAGVDWLRLWVKRRPIAENGDYYIEGQDGVIVASVDSETCDADEVSCA
jgi:SAM-dependent methyltransferase